MKRRIGLRHRRNSLRSRDPSAIRPRLSYKGAAYPSQKPSTALAVPAHAPVVASQVGDLAAVGEVVVEEDA